MKRTSVLLLIVSLLMVGVVFSLANVRAFAHWDKLGKGDEIKGSVYVLALDKEGKLYAGGVNGVNKWNGSSWSALKENVATIIRALAFDNDGALYAGAEGGMVSKWNNGSWLYLKGKNDVNALVFYKKTLYKGDNLGLWKWNDSAWVEVEAELNGSVNALAVDKSEKLYAGGKFGVKEWDGTIWKDVGGNFTFTGNVHCLIVDDSGKLYAGGYFTGIGNISANNIARRDGEIWSNLDEGVIGGGINSRVYSLALGKEGALYVGGQFKRAGGMPANNIARWDTKKQKWSTMENGINNGIEVNALAVDDSGALYVGGSFTSAGGVAAKNIARWGK